MYGIKVAEIEATITTIEATHNLCSDFEAAQLLLVGIVRREIARKYAHRTVSMAQTGYGDCSGGRLDYSGRNVRQTPNTLRPSHDPPPLAAITLTPTLQRLTMGRCET